MRSQRESETFRHGEGKTHEKAKRRLVDILKNDGWTTWCDIPFWVETTSLVQRNSYYHEFDIYAKKEYSKGRYGTQSELIVEIDGSSHDRPKQKNRDKTAEEYAAFFLPDAKFKRIDISLLLNPNVADANILDLLK